MEKRVADFTKSIYSCMKLCEYGFGNNKEKYKFYMLPTMCAPHAKKNIYLHCNITYLLVTKCATFVTFTVILRKFF